MTAQAMTSKPVVKNEQLREYRIAIPERVGSEEKPLTHESLLVISLEMWPQLDPDEIGMRVDGSLLHIFPAERIPINCAIFKHTFHSGNPVYINGDCPDRLAHLSATIEEHLGPNDFEHVFLIKSEVGIEVVRIVSKEEAAAE